MLMCAGFLRHGLPRRVFKVRCGHVFAWWQGRAVHAMPSRYSTQYTNMHVRTNAPNVSGLSCMKDVENSVGVFATMLQLRTGNIERCSGTESMRACVMLLSWHHGGACACLVYLGKIDSLRLFMFHNDCRHILEQGRIRHVLQV